MVPSPPFMESHSVGANSTTYTIVERGTKRGGKKLVSSDGYEYSVKDANNHSTKWRCTKRQKNNCCPANVNQYDDGRFQFGKQSHTHAGAHGVLEETLLRAKLKEASSTQKTASAKLVVETCILEADPQEHIPNPANLTKMI